MTYQGGESSLVVNGVYTNGSYSDPAWITSLAGSKISGNISGNAATATIASTVITNANLTGGVISSGNAATVVTNANLTGAISSIGNATSLGSFSSANLATALTDETGTGAAVFANSPVLITPSLGTPASGIATNLTGTASGLTAGNVTTNANLTGEATSSGNSVTLTNSAVIGKVLTGFASTTGAITASDTILNAFNKTDGITPTNWGNGSSNVIMTSLTAGATLTVVSGTSYATYLGFVTKQIAINYLRLLVRSVGSGSQTAEFGLFTSPSAPNGATQVLTKLIASGSVGSLIALNSVSNSSSFAQTVNAGTHLWGVVRIAMGTTQPTFISVALDCLTGSVLSTAATGSLTSLTSFTGGLIADSAVVGQSPLMYALLY